MMAISTTTAPSGANSSMNEADILHNRTLDVTRLDEGRGQPPNKEVSLKTKEYHIYSQLIRDQLESLSNSRNASSFISLLAGIIKPGYDNYGRPKPVDADKLTVVLRILSLELGQLDQQVMMPVIMKLLEFEMWADLHRNLTDAYIQFFNVLVSVNPKWWVDVATKIIRQFPEGARLDLAPNHLAIKQIMQNVPIASTAFSGIFSELFPHKSSSSVEITSYVENLLKVSQYAPDQAASIWRLIVTRLVELDVECEEFEARFDSDSESGSDLDDSDVDSDISGSDYDGYSDREGDYQVENINDGTIDRNSKAHTQPKDQQDIDTEVKTGTFKRNFNDNESHETLVSKRQRLENVDDGEEVTGVELELASFEQEPMRKKVDSVLSLILSNLSTVFTEERIVTGEATPLFNILLQVFKEVVLPTSRPQAVQFIWFYVVHGHKDLLASFVSLLLETALSPSVSIDQRCRAMQYVASFVARAKGLTRSQIVFVVGFLADWVKRYIREREVEVEQASSMARFRVLYSTVQALLYIFVFRHTILRTDFNGGAESEDDEADETQDRPVTTPVGKSLWEADLDKLLQGAINTKFNPLQYCQPDVVAMFARIAQREEVASCYSIIERNRWGKFRTSENTTTKTGASHGLFDNNRDSKLYDSFFPFQPLKLKNANLFIMDLYEKWSELDSMSESETEREPDYSMDDDENEVY